jgi:hypothetical protein
MFMEKPSCIRELKQLAETLSESETAAIKCVAKVKEIINCTELTTSEKLSKLKDLCKDHGK